MDKLSESLAEDTATRGGERCTSRENNRRRVPIFFRDRDYRTRYLGAEDKNKNAMPRG